MPSNTSRPRFRVAWFGTSIMEHYEAFNTQMFTQSDLPQIGSLVRVEEWHKRGYVQRLQLAMQVRYPHVDFVFENLARGGATSRDILEIVFDRLAQDNERFDLAYFGCGVNDVWRRFQGRNTEAVEAGEFCSNYQRIVELLNTRVDNVVCVGDAPVSLDKYLDNDALNQGIEQYNTIAEEESANATFIDVWTPFARAAKQLTNESLWSDGVHFSELGDALVFDLLQTHLWQSGIMSAVEPS